MKTIPMIALDFIDYDGLRVTSFQLCRPRAKGGIEAIAVCSMIDGNPRSTGAIDALEKRIPAIERLATRYAKRSVPLTFKR